MVLRMKNFDIMGVYWKIQFSGGGGCHEKAIYRGELPKGGLDSCRFKEGLGEKEGGGVFLGGWYPNAHYDSVVNLSSYFSV